MNTSNSSRK